jgi:hypothetical protein
MTGPGTWPVAFHRCTRSGSHTIGRARSPGGLDQGGGVGAGEEFLGEGVVDGLAEGGADALAGGRSGRARPAHAGADVGVAAGPGFQNLGVAGADLGEHGLDVAGLELVQPQVAQVRDEMDPDVGLVAAHGVLVDLQAGQPFGQVGGHGRGLREGHVGLDALPDGVQVGQGLAGAHGGQ